MQLGARLTDDLPATADTKPGENYGDRDVRPTPGR